MPPQDVITMEAKNPNKPLVKPAKPPQAQGRDVVTQNGRQGVVGRGGNFQALGNAALGRLGGGQTPGIVPSLPGFQPAPKPINGGGLMPGLQTKPLALGPNGMPSGAVDTFTAPQTSPEEILKQISAGEMPAGMPPELAAQIEAQKMSLNGPPMGKPGGPFGARPPMGDPSKPMPLPGFQPAVPGGIINLPGGGAGRGGTPPIYAGGGGGPRPRSMNGGGLEMPPGIEPKPLGEMPMNEPTAPRFPPGNASNADGAGTAFGGLANAATSGFRGRRNSMKGF